MIIECPDCGEKEQIRRKNNEDFIEAVCNLCGKIFEPSLVRCEAREERFVKK